MIDNQQTITH